ncbi:MAG: pectate lyase [Prevotella sp.]|nr:pectate lyase [Prevotella sp.]
MVATAQTGAPAFPGAEGHGRNVTGGRKADGTTKVYHVTNLNDSGSGSLRWALNQSGPRTIVFDVAGVIELASNLKIPANTTIAGQTAPYPGITLRYYTVTNIGNNVIIRFIRVRRGQERDVNDGADAIWQRNSTGIILDHCSFSWSIDEVASFYDNRNFTMQWCTIAEALTNAGHDKGAHGYGGIWGGKCASFHHNLIAHVQNRAPRLCGARYNWSGYDKTAYENSVVAERVDLRNNLIYNWGNGNGAYGGMGGYHNIVNNYYKAGPATKNKTRVFQCSTNASKDSNGALPDGLPGLYYINGNYVTAASSPENYDWKGVTQDSGDGVTVKSNGESTYLDSKGIYGPAGETVKIKLDSPIETGDITTHEATSAYQQVMACAGASLFRDEVDARYMQEALEGTATYTGSKTKQKGIVDVVADVNGYTEETFPTGAREADFDADGDGMADAWEQANGGDLDPNAYTLDAEKKWYTNLEVYLNSLVEDIMKTGNEGGESNFTEYYPVCNKTETGISNIQHSAISHTEYYDLNGHRLSAPQKGVSIRVEFMANGKKKTSKVIK